MWMLLLLTVALGITLLVFFKTNKQYKTKIESLEEKIIDKKQEIEHLQSKVNSHNDAVNELKIKNKKLKTTSGEDQRLIKGNQQLRNQLSELEEKNKLIQGSKGELLEQREKLKKKFEKKDDEISELKNENEELKTKFLQNENIKSYATIVKEALIVQTFLHNDTRQELQILHDFPELSEETIRNYLSHLCDINLLSEVDGTYRRNFSMDEGDHVLDKILFKMFDYDIQKFKRLLQ
ncbi:MAG: hypothetical protein U9R21_10060 [Candidatus Thermoplasmatota archaeon]|nr:hypothetical protein [Candidatus Thermoplasmatota archaeon]